MKIYSTDEKQIDNYLEGYRNYTISEILKDWEDENKDISVQNSTLFSDILEIDQIKGFTNEENDFLKDFLKQEKIEFCRQVTLDGEHSLIEKIILTFFVSLVERKLYHIDDILHFFSEMYSVSHHFGLTTEYFLKFNMLCKCFQFMIY